MVKSTRLPKGIGEWFYRIATAVSYARGPFPTLGRLCRITHQITATCLSPIPCVASAYFLCLKYQVADKKPNKFTFCIPLLFLPSKSLHMD